MKEPRKWKTVAIEGELLDKLQAEAKSQERSVSWMLGRILREHFTPK